MTSQEWLRYICNNDSNHRAYAIAEEIDQLQAENKKLREALEYISENSSDYDGGWCGIKARQALAGGE